jgi:O-antigen/teichoic acid export membrane protein
MRSLGTRLAVPARGAVAGSLASGLIGQLMLLVSGVVVARTLGPTDRGYLALLVLLPAVLQHVGTLGLPLATTYFIAKEHEDEPAVRRNLLAPVLAQAVVLVLLQGLLLYLLLDDQPDRVRDAALVSLALLPGAIADLYGKALLQGQGRYRAFNILRNATIAFYLVALAVVWAVDAADIVGITVAWVSANLLSGAVTLVVALRGRPGSAPATAGPSLRRMLGFGLAGLLGSLSPVATFRLDQMVVGLFLSAEALGLYVAGLAFTNLPIVISRGVAMIALPEVARATPDERRAATQRFVWLATALSGAVVAILILAAGELVPLLFGSDFEEAVTLTRILLVGAVFTGARRVLTDSVSGSGRPGLGSAVELVSGVVLVPLVLILTPIWEAEGVATALTIASAVSFVVLVVLVRRSDESRVRDEKAEALILAEQASVE